MWGKNDLQGASAQTGRSRAAGWPFYPASIWAHALPGRTARQRRQRLQAGLLRDRAHDNLNTFETYPGDCVTQAGVLTGWVALVPSQPIDLGGIRHITEIYANADR